MSGRILIVGGGQAGAQAAMSLRQLGHAGPIAIAGEEPDPPYERPPLSKEYLVGDRAPERLALRPPAFWAERGIDLLLSTRIIHLDPATRVAHAADGRALPYGTLIWASGGHARRLPTPGAELAGVHAIRTRQDVDRLRADLRPGARVLTIGGGYIGLESAAVLTKLGHRVTVVEAAPRLLARVAGAPVSEFYLQRHRAEGVDVRLNTGLVALHGHGRVAGAELSTGERIACDLVVVGIGLTPASGVLAAAGAETGDGVHVDAHCRTTLPDVYAIGDCACTPLRYAPAGRVRLESVAHAVDTAKAAAAHIVHGDAAAPYASVPWFWSNQYDLKLQTVGLSAGHDAQITRGEPARGAWSLAYLRAGVLVALDAINAPRDYVQARALIERGVSPDPGALADPSVPLKSIAEA